MEDLDAWMNLDDYEDFDSQMDYSGNGIQLITFTLQGESYGIDILKVRELISYSTPTVIPNVPECIKGVTNLRGVVVPVVDLRIKFGMPLKEYDKYTVIVVVKVGEKLIGIIVDTVSDVVFLSEDQIQPTPEFSADINTKFIEGMGQIKDDLVILLDIDCVLSEEELGLLPSQLSDA